MLNGNLVVYNRTLLCKSINYKLVNVKNTY